MVGKRHWDYEILYVDDEPQDCTVSGCSDPRVLDERWEDQFCMYHNDEAYEEEAAEYQVDRYLEAEAFEERVRNE